jgi:hydroxyethylthiazole kinase-like uncharacterized protein yjeF
MLLLKENCNWQSAISQLTASRQTHYNYHMQKYIAGSKTLVIGRDEVRAVDAWAIEEMGVPSVVLMENAGRSCVEVVIEKLANGPDASVCIFCGTGNNGGDGFVVARHLANRGVKVKAIICGDPSKIKGDAKINFEIIKNMGIQVQAVEDDSADLAKIIAGLSAGCDLVVDALFGTGLSGELKPTAVKLIEAINALDKKIVAVDIPSGLDCDTGKALAAAIKAIATVTFVALKRGFTNPEALRFTGEIYIASIGIETRSQNSEAGSPEVQNKE